MTISRTTLLVLVAVGLALLLGVMFAPVPSAPAALQVTILGRTNIPASGPMVIVSVTNQTARGWSFYFCAEVGTPTGWTDRAGWVEMYQKGSSYWLKPHGISQIVLPVPDRAAIWRFRCASLADASAFQWAWFRFVKRSGLARIGLSVQPQTSYSWTPQVDEMTAVSKSKNE
jgi:hypothetical protein